MTDPRTIRSVATLALAAACALSIAGCAAKTSPTAIRGDETGDHLVAFATDRGRAAGDLSVALYDLDGVGFHSLAYLDAAGIESDPCISDDGQFMAFVATRPGGAGGSDVYLYHRGWSNEADALLPLPGLNSSRDESWPRFTYDSVKLAFVTRLAGGEKRVRLYDPLSDSLVALPGFDAVAGDDDDQPAPNVDGSRIAFITTHGGVSSVRVWNRTGGVATIPALAGDGNDTEPSLSSDGRWLAFASTRTGGAGGSDVYLYDLVGNALVALPGLNTASDERHPSVSANGDVIVFQSDRPGGGGQNDLYRYVRSSGGTDQAPGFRDASNDVQPYLRYR